MAKSKVTPISTARQAAPRTIPLSDLTITWPRRHNFDGDATRPPVVLTGKHLAQRLAWIAASAWRLRVGPDADVFDETQAHLQLEGFAEVLRVLGSVDHVDVQTDFPALFHFLAEASRMMTAELTANEDAGLRLKDAVVTIDTPAAEAGR